MKLYSVKELRKSRIFFDREPSNFLIYLGYFLLLVIILFFIFIKFVPKNYIVRAQGSIEMNDKGYITPLVNSNVIDIHFKEGDVVKKGDIILTLSNGSEGVQETEIEKDIKLLTNKKDVFDKYEESLVTKVNLLQNNEAEQEFYGKVEYYLTQVNDENNEKKNIKKNIEKKNNELNNLKSEIEGIKSDLYKNYLKEFNRKQEDLNQLVLKRKTSNEEDELLVKDEIKLLERELQDLNNSYEKDLEEGIKGKNNEILAKQEEIQELEQRNNEQSSSTYAQLISELGTLRLTNNDKINELTSQKVIKNNDSNLLQIKSEQDGTLHYLSPLKKGLGLQAFQPVAQIDNGQNAKLIVDAFITAQDKSKVKVGDITKVSVSGINQTKYGVLKGKVKQISSGTIIQQNDGKTELFYSVNISINTSELKNKTDNKDVIKIVPSMPVLANIIYEKESYLEWILEQLNLNK